MNMQNAKLNIDIAQAQLKGAKLSYLPSVALAPNGGFASFAGSDFIGTYQIPLAVSWEVDIFGKLLNNKRSAEASLEQTKAYNQAVRSQIIGGVANCYYAIATIERQIELNKETAKLWSESIEVMKNLKLDGRLNEAAIVQSTASYYNLLASITDLEVALDETNNTMSLLLNVLPQKWSVSPQAKFALGQNQGAHGLTGTVGQNNCAADLLIGVTGVNAKADVDLNGLVKLCLGGLANQIQSLGGIVQSVLFNQLCAVCIFLSHCFVPP